MCRLLVSLILRWQWGINPPSLSMSPFSFSCLLLNLTRFVTSPLQRSSSQQNRCCISVYVFCIYDCLLLRCCSPAMTRVRHFLALATLFNGAFSQNTGLPFAMTWSSKSLGPDGPWQAVQVGIGTPAQQVALYPAGTFRSHVLTAKICSNATLSPDVCFASAAGLYAVESSSTGLDTIVRAPSAQDFTHGGLQIQGSDGVSALDQMDIGILDSSRTSVIVPNVTIAMYDNIAAIYPGGDLKVLQVGTLALGYLGTVNQSFSRPGQDSINGSLIPGYLQEKGVTPSNTFDLHIGSVNPKIKGSLYFGGYDQARICGNV